MGRLIDEISGIDTNQFDSKTLSSGQTHIDVTLNLENTHRSLLDERTSIDDVVLDLEQHLVHGDTIVETMEDIFRVWIHGETILQVFVTLQKKIDEIGEGTSLFNRVGVHSIMLRLNLGHLSCSSLDEGAKLRHVSALHANHHGNKFLPRDDTIFVLILGGKHFLDFIISD